MDRNTTVNQILQEFTVTMTRKVKPRWSSKEALAVLDDLVAWPVLAVDVELIRESVLLSDEARLSLWDALVVNAAGAAVRRFCTPKIVNPLVDRPEL